MAGAHPPTEPWLRRTTSRRCQTPRCLLTFCLQNTLFSWLSTDSWRGKVPLTDVPRGEGSPTPSSSTATRMQAREDAATVFGCAHNSLVTCELFNGMPCRPPQIRCRQCIQKKLLVDTEKAAVRCYDTVQYKEQAK